MLQFYNTNIRQYVDKYKDGVVEKLTNPEFNIVAENEVHTKYISQCSRGSEEAKVYVIDNIKVALEGMLTDNDKRQIFAIVEKEIDYFYQKLYEELDSNNINIMQERKITYYQLLVKYSSPKQREILDIIKNRVEDKDLSLSIDILANEVYKKEYGLDIIDDIYEMRLNNIEVHSINKIRVETADGVWYTISDCRFHETRVIKLIAQRLLSQKAGGDLTEDECERESMLLDGARITVALKPACALDMIFIKKFDSFTVSKEEMLKNGTVTEEMIEDLKILAKGRANIIITGGVNTGKSTFLKMYIGLVPDEYKIGLVDPSRDTDLITLYDNKDIVTLYETDTYSMNDQFSKLLRMNRHILGISEARSYEVEQAIKAMLRGNSGSFLTLHSIKAKDLVDNIAWMCLENGIPQDMKILRSRIASAVDIVIRPRQENSGERRVDEIVEIVATDDLEHPFVIKPIYKWDRETDKIERVKDYEPSQDLIDKLEYYGCTEEEIRKFKNGGFSEEILKDERNNYGIIEKDIKVSNDKHRSIF